MSRFAILTFLWVAFLVCLAFVFAGLYCFWAIAILSLGYLIIVGLGAAFIQWHFFLSAFCHGDRNGKQIALTFDDGPDAASTPALLDLLANHSIKATFFCVGQKVLAEPELARRIIDEGHQIGNHSHRHSWWINFLTAQPMLNEIRLAQSVIHKTTGINPVIYRPPMGLTNPHLRKALRASGLTCVGWDVRSLDKTHRNAANILRRITGKTTGGSVILLHDGGAKPEKLLAIVSALIANLQQHGYNFVRIDNLMGEMYAPFD